MDQGYEASYLGSGARMRFGTERARPDDERAITASSSSTS